MLHADLTTAFGFPHREAPEINRPSAEGAITAHLSALEIPPLPVTWMDDAVSGWRLEFEAGIRRDWGAAWNTVGERALDDARPSRRFKKLRMAMDDEPERIAYRTALRVAAEASRSHPPIGVPVIGEPWLGWVTLGAAWGLATRSNWHRNVWFPLYTAYRAGLWLFWVAEKHMIAVPRPRIETREGRLHSDRGPAISWPGGTAFWFVNGVRVPRHVIETPELLTAMEICREQNIEVQRIMTERYGMGRFLGDLNAQQIGKDAFGTLYRAHLNASQPLTVVRVTNATREPDGTRRDYFLRVPPRIRTPREAVAWTFGLKPEEYRLIVET